ncbi:7482_t:CDS:2 [Ambispora leptoticha]|uniref:7482_t:CDS:1 n=1 Tax=Ambispora leptoticha TaxID=144679 RepID=A0A9N9FLY0_9GLOM|nr:7482_t:CDS:2 [Ambispora leptoticha]
MNTQRFTICTLLVVLLFALNVAVSSPIVVATGQLEGTVVATCKSATDAAGNAVNALGVNPNSGSGSGSK